MNDTDDILSEHLKKLGRKGGKVKSSDKKAAALANLEKALEARWPGRRYRGRLAKKGKATK